MKKTALPLLLAAMSGLTADGQTTTFEEPLVSGSPSLLPDWSGFSRVVLQYGSGQVQDRLAGAGIQALEMSQDSSVAWSPDDLSVPDGLVLESSFLLRLDTLSTEAPVIPPEILSAVVYANASGLMALNGNGSGGGTWQTLQALSPGTFYAITITRDYATQSYDVRVDGALVADDYGFKDAVASTDGPFTSTFETSEKAFLDDVGAGFADYAAPTPNPMTFTSAPAPAGPTSITMTAIEASDPMGPVEYFFDCITPGGSDSGWQVDRSYLDSGLTTGVSYTYQVKARDTLGNETMLSAPASAIPETDTSAPRIVSVSPANGSFNVSPNTELVLTLDESIQIGTGNIFIKERLGNDVVATVPMTSAFVTTNGSEVTLNLPTNLGRGTGYYVEVDAGALMDEAGNPFSGIAGSALWNFTTAVSSQPVIYEPFDYAPTGSTDGDGAYLGDGNQSGALGLDGMWSQQINNIEMEITNAGLTFTDGGGKVLPVAGKSILRSERTGTSVLSIAVNPTATTSLTADNTTMWMSFLYVDTGFSGPDSSVMLASQPLASSNDHSLNSAGYGVGILIGEDASAVNASVEAGYYLNTTTTTRVQSTLNLNDAEGTVFLLAAKVNWKPDGTPDEIFVFNVTDLASEPAEGEAIASNTFNMPLTAQQSLDTLNIGETQIDAFDEIRFGTSFGDVVGDGSSDEGFEAYLADPRFGLDPDDQAFNQDPDGDGLMNGLEAWFGTHPGEFNVGLVSDGTTTFTHPQNTFPPSDLTGFYEWSPNLVDWYADGSGPGGGPTVSFVPTTVGTTTTVIATPSQPLGRLFLRAGVIQN